MKKILLATCAALLPTFYTAEAQPLVETDPYNMLHNSTSNSTRIHSQNGTRLKGPILSHDPEKALDDINNALNFTDTLSLFFFPAGDLKKAWEIGRKGKPFDDNSVTLWDTYCYYALIAEGVKAGLDPAQVAKKFDQHITNFTQEFNKAFAKGLNLDGTYELIKHAAEVGKGNRDAFTGFLQLLEKLFPEKLNAFEKAAETITTVVQAIQNPTSLDVTKDILERAQGTIRSLTELLERTKAAKNLDEIARTEEALKTGKFVLKRLTSLSNAATKHYKLTTAANPLPQNILKQIDNLNGALKATRGFVPLRYVGKAARFMSGRLVYQATDLLSFVKTAYDLSDAEGRSKYWKDLQGASIVPHSFSEYIGGLIARIGPLSPTRAVTRTAAWGASKFFAPEAFLTTQLKALHGGTFSGAFTFPCATLAFRWGYNYFFSEETSKVLAQLTTTAGAWYLGYAPITIAADVILNTALDPYGTWAGIQNIAGSTYNVGAWALSSIYAPGTTGTGPHTVMIPSTPNGTSTEL